MKRYKGFITKREAETFRKARRGSLYGESGPLKADYWFCVAMGLDVQKYHYAVIWEK